VIAWQVGFSGYSSKFLSVHLCKPALKRHFSGPLISQLKLYIMCVLQLYLCIAQQFLPFCIGIDQEVICSTPWPSSFIFTLVLVQNSESCTVESLVNCLPRMQVWYRLKLLYNMTAYQHEDSIM